MPRPDGSTSVTVPTATERESSDLSHIKLRNLDYERHATGGRGGVDDLISLTHLHEPAILDVLALRYAKDCIYSAWRGPNCGANHPGSRVTPPCRTVEERRSQLHRHD